jgi:hypothetical protein
MPMGSGQSSRVSTTRTSSIARILSNAVSTTAATSGWMRAPKSVGASTQRSGASIS